jgi:hypothetical protein
VSRLAAICFALSLLAWTPRGELIWGVADSEAYIRAEHALEARELCGLVMSHAGPVVVESGNTGSVLI